jgi:phospholipase/lecithinase/hemolysin
VKKPRISLYLKLRHLHFVLDLGDLPGQDIQCMRFLFGSAAVLFTASCVFASGVTVDQMVVFGDSLSDTGNAAYATGGLLPGPATNYAAGEFTNGPQTNPATSGPLGIWVDQVSPRLNVPVPQAGFAIPGGTNFAVGSASTGTNPGFPTTPLQAPGVDQQLGAYLAGTGGVSSSTALYSFWAGANDISNSPTPTTGVQAADNIYANILALSGTGAKTFLWFNLPNLGLLPAVTQQGPTAVALASAASAAFNSEWQTDVDKLKSAGLLVIGVDIASLFDHVEADHASGCAVGPSDPFCFANVTDPAQGNMQADPNTYLFWDGEHPTTAAHALVADLVYSDVEAVPEPYSWSLLAFGGVGLLAISRIRRANSGMLN